MIDIDERERAKRRDETDLDWRQRIARFDQERRAVGQPLVTLEAERHGDYRDEFVMHVETQTLARTRRNRVASPFLALYERGTIDKDQYGAALEIAAAAEMITRSVSIRGARLAARVDNSGAAHDALVEKLATVRLEVAYTLWRSRLPMPRAMFVDMIVHPGSLKAIARRHGMGWPRAKRLLIRALDRWPDIRERVAHNIDQEDLDAAHKRLSATVRKNGIARA